MSEVFSLDEIVRRVNVHKLTSIVRSVLKKQDIELLQWHWKSLYGGGGGIQNSAVYRFEGSCTDPGQTMSQWSVILKIIRYQNNDDVSGSHYWKREFEAYQSGWLSNLPTDTLRAPVCYESEIITGKAVTLWLEDLEGTHQEWNRNNLAIAARHLGEFNGAYLAHEAKPNYPWLSRNWIRRDVEIASKILPHVGKSASDTFLGRVISPERTAKCHDIYKDREIFLTAIAKLPKTIQHLDAFSRNLFSITNNGQQSTIAIDWAFVGLETIGAELVSLFWVTLLFSGIEASDMADYERDLFENYIDGLKSVGLQPDRDLIRLGFTASLGLRHFGTMCYVTKAFTDETLVQEFVNNAGSSYDSKVKQLVSVGKYIDGLTEEARQLINAIY